MLWIRLEYLWLTKISIGRSRLAHKGRTSSLTWSEGGIGNIPQVLWWSLTTLSVLNGVTRGLGVMSHMIRRHESCSRK